MQNKRQGEIVRYLSEVKFSKIEQLAEVFQVSIETIRRDLLELEKDSSIKRIREALSITICGHRRWNLNGNWKRTRWKSRP